MDGDVEVTVSKPESDDDSVLSDEAPSKPCCSDHEMVLLNPRSPVRQLWVAFVCTIGIYNAVSIPIRLTFDIDSSSMLYMLLTDIATDVILVVDIVWSFFVGHFIMGVLDFKHRGTFSHYFFGEFPMDAAALIPVDYFYIGSPVTRAALRINRMLRIYRFPAVFEAWERYTHRPFVIRLFKMMATVVLILHWVACMFFNLVLREEREFGGEWPEKSATWARGVNAYVHRPFSESYIRAFYWSTSLISGPLAQPSTQLELYFMLPTLMLSVLMISTIIGNIGSLIRNRSASAVEWAKKMEVVNLWFRFKGIRKDLQNRIRAYYEYLWTRQAGLQDTNILADIPVHLRTQVYADLNHNILRKVPLFERCQDEGFLQALIRKLKTEIYAPGDIVVREGEMGQCMFFVTKGVVKVCVQAAGEVARLTEGQYFGEIALLFRAARNATIIAVTYVDVFILYKEDVDTALLDFPQYAKFIYDVGQQKLTTSINEKTERDRRKPSRLTRMMSVFKRNSSIALEAENRDRSQHLVEDHMTKGGVFNRQSSGNSVSTEAEAELDSSTRRASRGSVSSVTKKVGAFLSPPKPKRKEKEKAFASSSPAPARKGAKPLSFVEKMYQLFSEMDTDGDGINEEQLGVLMHRAGERPTPQMVKLLVAELDADGSGRIEFDEFLTMVKRVRAGELKMLQNRFRENLDNIHDETRFANESIHVSEEEEASIPEDPPEAPRRRSEYPVMVRKNMELTKIDVRRAMRPMEEELVQRVGDIEKDLESTQGTLHLGQPSSSLEDIDAEREDRQRSASLPVNVLPLITSANSDELRTLQRHGSSLLGIAGLGSFRSVNNWSSELLQMEVPYMDPESWTAGIQSYMPYLESMSAQDLKVAHRTASALLAAVTRSFYMKEFQAAQGAPPSPLSGGSGGTRSKRSESPTSSPPRDGPVPLTEPMLNPTPVAPIPPLGIPRVAPVAPRRLQEIKRDVT